MRVYHLLSSEYALSDIALQRIKISNLNDLNDPFELLAANVGKLKNFRTALRIWKDDLNDTTGLLCFSKNWENPVLWSHYAAGHYGICLGFDLKDELAREVKYSGERLRLGFTSEPTVADLSEELMHTLLGTKFESWSYEEEVRAFVHLDELTAEGSTYFYDFSDDLVLREVILGPLCSVPVDRVRNLVQTLYDSVVVIKARLAFKYFKVVPNRRYENH